MVWSAKLIVCSDCGADGVKNFSRGLCRRCYMTKYRNENRERCRAYARKWARANGKSQREKLHFDGVRQQALDRDGNQCVRCHSTKSLTVHHKDRSGRGAEVHNNDLNNLETLCRRCHAAEHREELNASKAPKTHCKRGHSFAEHGRFNGRQYVCKECCRIRAAMYRASAN